MTVAGKCSRQPAALLLGLSALLLDPALSRQENVRARMLHSHVNIYQARQITTLPSWD